LTWRRSEEGLHVPEVDGLVDLAVAVAGEVGEHGQTDTEAEGARENEPKLGSSPRRVTTFPP
jgi:hypothetical protein